MRKTYLLLVFITAIATQAQVTLSTQQLDFGDVLTTENKELAINVTNTTGSNLIIDDVNLYNKDFSYSVPSATIAPGSSVKLRVTFTPKHNLAYNTELIFVMNDGSEHRLDLIGNGKYEGTYYSATFNKTHQDLKNSLKTILASGYKNLGYSGARDKMYGDIDNVGGKVTCVYTGRQATFNTRSGANSNSFNCEHTWPQSKFSKKEPERADIHHLFPTDNNSNSRRGSYPFGEVSSASWSEGGSKLGGGKFEPRDEQKGATARAMIYFAIRYQDYGNFIDGQENLLKEWHSDNAPTAFEITRNNKIYSYQKNRNPFVDHPEFIERMNKIGSTDTKPVVKEAKVSQNTISYTSISSSSERYVYIVNTGNQTISEISDITSENGNVIIKGFETAAVEGEAAKITIGFKDLGAGSHSDKLIINLVSQVGSTINIPITFTSDGTAGVNDHHTYKLSSYYNPASQSITVFDAPTAIESIQIWNTSGQSILLNERTSTFTDIPFEGHDKGVYFVVIKTGTEVYTSKILVY